MKHRLIFDFDWLVFKAASAAEERFVRVTNNKNGEVNIFKNRSEVYGRGRAKDSGWLALQEGLKLDDLTIEDDRDVKPVAFALNTAKDIINRTRSMLQNKDYYGYVSVSGSKNFRKEICTLLPYKGNREGLITPFYRNEVIEYLQTYHNACSCDGIEPDDAVVQDMTKALKTHPDAVAVINEKDFLGESGNWYNYDYEKLYKVRGFGELHREGKDVKGAGRMWKYFQVSFCDAADNYYANCFSDKQNGQVAVYNRLKDCKNDKEAFQAMKEHFQYLYPEPKVITNWRGDTFEINWLYVMQEMFDMAHLRRWEGDRVIVRDVMNKLGVEL